MVKIRIIPRDEVIDEINEGGLSKDTVILVTGTYNQPTHEDNDVLFYIEDLRKSSELLLNKYQGSITKIIKNTEVVSYLLKYTEMFLANIYPEQEYISDSIKKLIEEKVLVS